jgi:hypothetical protein
LHRLDRPGVVTGEEGREFDCEEELDAEGVFHSFGAG